MDSEWLRAFQAAARTRSFSAASRQINVSQSALSRQIQALEEQLGVSLFQRGPHGVHLSPAGERFLEFAEAILSLIEQALASLSPAGTRGRTLRVAASSTPGTYLLPCALTELRKRHPEIRLALKVANSATTEEAVATGEADIGVIGCPPGRPGLAAVPFTRDRLVLVTGGAGNNEKRPDLLILREEGSCTRRAVESMLRCWTPAEEAPDTLEIGSTEAIKNVLACGVGSAYLPAVAVLREIQAGILRLAHPWPLPEGLYRDLWFVFPKGTGPNRETLELMAIAVRQARSSDHGQSLNISPCR